jgi:hypothetical protein
MIIKFILCLWMATVIFLFLLLFLPSEYLSFLNQQEMHSWVVNTRNWIQPYFIDLYIKH